MVQVGVRELKAHLSAYLRRVRGEGESIHVTDRGHVVAVLSPPPPATEGRGPSLQERILARGGRPAVRQGGLDDLPPLSDAVRQVDAAALLAETRGEP